MRGRLKTFKSRYSTCVIQLEEFMELQGSTRAEELSSEGTLSDLSPSLQVNGENTTIYKFKPLKIGRLDK